MNIVETLKAVNQHGGLEDILFGLISGQRPSITSKIDGYESIEYTENSIYSGQYFGVFKLGEKIYRGEIFVDSYGDVTSSVDEIIAGIKEVAPKQVTRVEYEAV